MTESNDEIPQNEGYLVEFKDFRGGISVKELGKTLCAFANTEGGSIYLGVTDSRQIVGAKITPVLEPVAQTHFCVIARSETTKQSRVSH